MKVALDSNVLAYLVGVERGPSDPEKITLCRTLIRRLADRVVLVVPAQTTGELYNVMLEGRFDPATARSAVHQVMAAYHIAYADAAVFTTALDLAVDHKLQIRDSLILCSAAAADCTILLSEDMQDGFTTRGVTIANPFLPRLQPALARLIAD